DLAAPRSPAQADLPPAPPPPALHAVRHPRSPGQNYPRPAGSNNPQPSLAPPSAPRLARLGWSRQASDCIQAARRTRRTSRGRFGADLSRLGRFSRLSGIHAPLQAAFGKFRVMSGFLRRPPRGLLASRILGGDLGAIALAEHSGRAPLCVGGTALRGRFLRLGC